MRMLLIGLMLAAGCVSMRPVQIAEVPPADCGRMLPATAREHSIVYSAPDNTSESIATLGALTPVCVSRRSRGFGLLAVRLPDGRRGYMNEDSLHGLIVDSAPTLPYGLE
jgi:hypothetical protein